MFKEGCYAGQGLGYVTTPIWEVVITVMVQGHCSYMERRTVSGYEGMPYKDVLGKTFTSSTEEGRRGYPPERIGRYSVSFSRK